MTEKKYYKTSCAHNKNCPVYQGSLVLEEISTSLIRNVFCNRGVRGWKNCERFKMAEEGVDIPDTATPYSNGVKIMV
ncbi:MAG: hypothetical protein JNL03_00075 [Prolixibacteraceae bacterium]|nr:hypothetical protein [Prolixibacteraceae bacterium]